MSHMTARNVFIGSWVLAFVMIGWASFAKKQGMPQPVQLIKTSAVWTLLGIVSEGAPQLAAIMGMGLLIPLFFIAQGGNPQNAPTGSANASGSIASGVIASGVIA